MRSQEKDTAREGESQLSAADLARAAARLPGFVWLPGMRGEDYAHGAFLVTQFHNPEASGYDEFPAIAPDNEGEVLADAEGAALALSMGWPDLADPATGGCLLHLLGASVRLTISECESGLLWRMVYWKDDMHAKSVPASPTLGEACARAALALGRWPGGGAR